MSPYCWTHSSSAHQPAGFGIVTRRICRGNFMERCQVDQLDTPAGEKGVRVDKKGVGPLAYKSCPKTGHRSMQSACPKSAKTGRSFAIGSADLQERIQGLISSERRAGTLVCSWPE